MYMYTYKFISSAIQLYDIRRPVSVGLGTAVIAVGQSVRIGASVLSVLGTEFSTKERLFIAMARFPKATVQVSKSFYNAKENYR